MKKEAFNFDDEDKNSEKKRQNEGLTKKRRKNFESDEKEIVSMKKARQAREYYASTYKRPNIFQDSPNTIYHQSDAKISKLKEIIDSESEPKIKINSVEIDYEDESVWTESVWSVESEQHSFVFSNNLNDIYNLIQEDSDNNWMFRALSRTTFGSPEYHREIRVQVANYIEVNREQFENFIVGDFNQYVKKIRDSDYWGGNQELVAFSELYGVNIEVYDRITSNSPRYIIENGVQQTTIRLFYWGTHYDSLISYESDKEHIKYFRVKQKEYRSKNKAKLIENKLSNLFAGERINKCSNNFVSSIYEYLINGSYPEEIKKIKNTFKRKNAKSKFRRLVKQNKKYKNWWMRGKQKAKTNVQSII